MTDHPMGADAPKSGSRNLSRMRRRDFLVSSAAASTAFAFGQPGEAAALQCDPAPGCTANMIDQEFTRGFGLTPPFDDENFDSEVAACVVTPTPTPQPDELASKREYTTEVVMGLLWTDFGRAAFKKNPAAKLPSRTVRQAARYMRGNIFDQTNDDGVFEGNLEDLRARWKKLGTDATKAESSEITAENFILAWPGTELPPNDEPYGNAIDEEIEMAAHHMWFMFGQGVESVNSQKSIGLDVIKKGRALSRRYVKKNMANCNDDMPWPYAKVGVCSKFAGRRAAKRTAENSITADDFSYGWCEVKEGFERVCYRFTTQGKEPPSSVACS
jgi:hypothetical protein